MLYPWHPWADRPVHVHAVIEKAGRVAFRCSLTGTAPDRRLEVPAWMFDRSARHGWQVGATPAIRCCPSSTTPPESRRLAGRRLDMKHAKISAHPPERKAILHARRSSAQPGCRATVRAAPCDMRRATGWRRSAGPASGRSTTSLAVRRRAASRAPVSTAWWPRSAWAKSARSRRGKCRASPATAGTGGG